MEKTEAPKNGLALLLMSALALTILAGCSGESETSAKDQETQTILEKLDAMQVQVSEMEENLTELTGDDGPEVIMAGLKHVEQFTSQFDDLEARVNAAAIAADSTVVPESEENRASAYFEALAPLEELSDELDLLEETYISAFGEGTLSEKDIWTLETRKGEIEDMISLTEDTLKFRMSADE